MAAGHLVDEEPAEALAQARAARALAARVAAVREAVGIAAYAAGEWAEALAEFRTARRMTGDQSHLPVMADCERALGRPERALDLAQSPEAATLPRAERVEMRIVESGARRDLGQLDAALVTLQGPDLDATEPALWTARLRYAYADTLFALGRIDEARTWFVAAAAADETGETGADARLLEIDGVIVLETDDEIDSGEDTDGGGSDGEDTDGEDTDRAGSADPGEPRGAQPRGVDLTEAEPEDRDRMDIPAGTDDLVALDVLDDSDDPAVLTELTFLDGLGSLDDLGNLDDLGRADGGPDGEDSRVVESDRGEDQPPRD